MTQLALILEAFHFLRPWWLVLVPATGLLWWRVRRAHQRREPSFAGIAPHLRAALTVGKRDANWIEPIDTVAAILVLLALGAAGPTWTRMTDPTAAEGAPVVILLAVTPSMLKDDIAPNRLERANQKVRDFLTRRGKVRTGLVVYAGSAHTVVPMTADTDIIALYLAGLSPDIMPRPGNALPAAIDTAQGLLLEDQSGGILLITDTVDPADVRLVNDLQSPIAVLSMLPEGTRDRGIDAMSRAVVSVRADDRDVAELDRMLTAAWRRAMLEDSTQPWADRGIWLAWPAALILAGWFRRGWTMRWAALVFALVAPPQARADGLADWFWTPDQQGQRAFDRKDFGIAAERFTDPLWRGYALYRSGRYPEAIAVLDRVETAQAAMIQGLAHIRSRGYRAGVAAFETALARDPAFPGAAKNLATAKAIVAYIEETQEASGTEDDTEMTADEVVLDNEDARGEDTDQDVPTTDADVGLLSAEQWMSTVQTDTSDFLRQRFALEAAQRERVTSEPATGAAE